MKKTRAAGPHIPADYKAADAFAIQQVMAGTADAHQQQRAMKWIIEQASGMYEFQYYPTDRETSFALGRGFVGQQIVKLSKLNTSTLRRVEENEV
jgi:hypothetical protein